MLLIGRLEQVSLARVLQRAEDHEKTGLFKIQQETQWVDLYFRDGRLLCISQQHVNKPLGERLVESGVISAQALQQAMLVTGDALPDETRLVITLMDLGYVEREELRAWAAQEAIQVLQNLLIWTGGELYFEEEVQPPAGRLLVSLSVSTLLSAIATPVSLQAALPGSDQQPAPAASSLAASASTSQSAHAQMILEQETIRTEIVNAPTLVESTQFQQKESETQYPSLISDLSASLLSGIGLSDDSLPFHSLQQAPAPSQPDFDPLIPVQVTTPVLPGRVDISLFQPDTVLAPVDLSTLRAANQRVQITPAQWCLLTQVDGRTTLQTACMQLGLAPHLICQLAGELLAMGLVSVLMPGAMNDGAFPVSPQVISGNAMTGYAAPVAVAAPVTSGIRGATAIAEIETQSQWGNGGNGAKFVPGRGWVTGPQPLLVAQPNNPNNVYAGGVR